MRCGRCEHIASAIRNIRSTLELAEERDVAELDPGWLNREMKHVAALQRASGKMVDAERRVRRNGYKKISVELTAMELRELIAVGQLEAFAK